MIKNEKISIITASYNSFDTIVETYNSIKNQSHSDWEWLVTDDCSSDDTIALLNEIAAKDERVTIFQNEFNSGAAVARNNSLSQVSGSYIAFIDSDDIWLSNKLEKQLAFLSEDIHFSFTAYELIDEGGGATGQRVDFDQTGSFTYDDMLNKKATLGCSTVMLRRSAFNDITMPLLRTGQDYALWLKLLRTGQNAYILNDVHTQYRILPNSISRNKFKKSKRQWQIYREVEKLPLLKSIVCFCNYAWRAVFRK
jgi:glycosyltransferase involved in cell wall biosynthesis